jgi:beta-ribofuranosylaminobenzene 5'-phosphate synthase
MIRVRANSRLHFGLLSLPTEDGTAWPDLQGEPAIPTRQFGGVGLMVRDPGIQIALRPAATWSAEGPLAERALALARRFVLTLAERERQTFHIMVEKSAPEHMGLGTGTQLGLAVAKALAVACRIDLSVEELAQRIGRGARSALGIYGFAQGGFVVDGGKRAGTAVAPLIARLHFPEDWRILIILPRTEAGLHGVSETDAFARLGRQPADLRQTEALCRLVLLGLLPALVDRDLPAFSEALYDFNRRVGEMFRPLQGGVYSSSQTAAAVEFVRQEGIAGVGQSSWGPAVFAVVAADQTAQLARRLSARFGDALTEVVETAAANQGAAVL